MINSICTMYDIMQENVSLVEDLHKRREPLPRIEALYLLAPEAESVRAVIDDFRTDIQEQRRNQKMYKSAHLVFLSPLPDALLQLIGESVLAEHIRTLKEINMHFMVAESQVFLTNMAGCIPRLFGTGLQDRQQSLELRRRMNIALTTFLVTMGERPYIRASRTDMAQDFAEGLEAELTGLQRSLPGYPPARALENRSTLLVVDRSVDLLAPLLHEFTYGAMAYDLLGIDPATNTYERTFIDSSDQEHTEATIIDERDPLWVQLRHGHIGKVGTVLSRQFQDFLAANKGAMQLTSSSKASAAAYSKGAHGLRELRDAFNTVPQYRDMRSKYSLHMNLAGACMDQMDDRKLVKLATFQQKCVMGDKMKALDELHTVLGLAGLTRPDIVRTIAIFSLTQAASPETRNSLYARYALTEAERASIENLTRIGADFSRPVIQTVEAEAASSSSSPSSSSSKASKSKKGAKGGKKAADTPSVSRYTPVIKLLLEDSLADVLSRETYRYVGTAPAPSEVSVATKRSTWVANKLSRQQAQERKAARASESISPFVGSRLFVFVLGGITLSEIRAVYETTKDSHQEVFIGSTHILTPQVFASEVSALV